MRHVFVASQHHHSSWYVHLLDCVTDSIQTDHHDQLDISFQVFEGALANSWVRQHNILDDVN